MKLSLLDSSLVSVRRSTENVDFCPVAIPSLARKSVPVTAEVLPTTLLDTGRLESFSLATYVASDSVGMISNASTLESGRWV